LFEHLRTSAVFIVEFHAMLAMKISSVSMRYGSPRQALVMTLCISPCTDSGYSHEKALSMRTGEPSSLTKRSSGSPASPAPCRPAAVGLHRARVVGRARAGRDGPRERRLVAEPAGPVDGAQQRHQDRQRTDGLEAVAVRRQAAHRVEGHRIAGDGVVLICPSVGPGDRQLDLLVARRDAHLVRQAADGLGRDAGDALGPLGRVVLDALLQQLEGRLDRCAVGQLELAQQARVGASACRPRRGRVRSHHSLFCGSQQAFRRRPSVAHDQAELVAGLVLVHQLAGVGVAHQEVAVVQAQAMISWIRASSSAPSVPGRIGTHSSAIAE
jgi:hypothetical protein